ncbi:MAG: M23 family peptidase, partial [Eudoraea sp.]|nr:M23 family peptidase [Eudoraea sp.]
VDPFKEKLPAAEPLPEEVRKDYFDFITPQKVQLDCIEFSERPDEELLTLN